MWPRKLSFELPQSFRLLTNIRSLLVENADLGDISILGSLQSLETLDLNRCTIDELPQEMAKLKELRLLNFDHCTIESNNPFEVIQRCSSLEELYFWNSFNDFCQEITIPTLERYHLTRGYNVIYDSSLSKCVSLRNDYLSEATFKHVMQTAEHLKLERIKKKGWTNLMPEIVPIDQGMNDLIELHLQDDSQLQCLVDTKHIGSQVPNVFAKLAALKLEEMKNLRSLFKGNLKLCNLKTVKIKECSTLVSVFHLSPSGSLPLLEELNIYKCEQLENIFTYERRVDDAIEVDGDNDNNKSCNSMFPNLKVINISYCPKLQVILPVLSTKDLLLLEAITIEYCDNLKHIFGQQQDVELASLKELNLKNVPNFIGIFPESYHSIEGSSNSISKPQTQLQLQVEPVKSNIFSWSPMCCYRYKLKGTTSTKVPSISEDQPQACSISTESSSYCHNIWDHAQCLLRLSHVMCNIKEIELNGIPRIKSVFTLSVAQKMSLLERLTIYHCGELEHIVVDIGDGIGTGVNIVFPKLKELKVQVCQKVKYIFGHINASDHHDQNSNEIQLHLPALKSLNLYFVPSLIGMCPKEYQITFPPLKELGLFGCPKVDVKSIGDFTVNTSISRYQDNTTIRQFSGNMEYFLALERLAVYDSNAESILCLNEENEWQINLGLQNIVLGNLPLMIYLFVGPKNAFALKNLKSIVICRCEKLEIVFSTSILRCLSQLSNLRIENCNELKCIIEDDIENQRMSNFMSSKTYFPVLKTLAVVKCNKLKSVFPISMSKELLKLEAMIINEADVLEEIFKSVGDDQKIEIPNLKVVAFLNLPSLCHVQGIQFQAVANRFVQNCKKFSLTSFTSSGDRFIDDFRHIHGIDPDTCHDLSRLFRQLEGMAKDVEHMLTSSQGSEISDEEGTVFDMLLEDANLGDSHETTQTNNQVSLNDDAFMRVRSTIQQQFPKDGEIIVSGLGIPSVDNSPANSQELMNEQSMHQRRLKNQEHPLGETDATVKSSQINNLEGCTSEKTEAATMSTISQPKNEAITTQDVDVKNRKETRDPSQIDEKVEDGDDQIATTSFSDATTETNNKVSWNDDGFKTVRSNVDNQFPKKNEEMVSKSSITSQLPFVPSKGDPSQKVEDLSSSLLVTRELELLVSKKHLDYENLSLLSDFLVNHPSVLLRDTSLSNKYKGYAYNCLVDLLKFLKTHSVLEVLDSCQTEFVELLQDARSFGFDKDWFDGIERRTLFPDLKVSQDVLKTLSVSKKQVTKDVEVLRLKIEDLKNQLTSSQAFLNNIIQQEAALSAPIGY